MGSTRAVSGVRMSLVLSELIIVYEPLEAHRGGFATRLCDENVQGVCERRRPSLDRVFGNRRPSLAGGDPPALSKVRL